jgi:hypothetical protein
MECVDMSDEQKEKLHSECRNTTQQQHWIFVCENDERALEAAYSVATKEKALVIGTIGHIDHGVTTNSFEGARESFIIKAVERFKNTYTRNFGHYYNQVPKPKKQVDFIAKRRR